MKQFLFALLLLILSSCNSGQLIVEDKSNSELHEIMKKYNLTESHAKSLQEAFEPGSGYDEFRGVSIMNLNDVRGAISNGRQVLVVKYFKGTTFVNVNQPDESKL